MLPYPKDNVVASVFLGSTQAWNGRRVAIPFQARGIPGSVFFETYFLKGILSMKQTTNHVLRLAVLAALAGTSVGAYAADPVANELPTSTTINNVTRSFALTTGFSPSATQPLQVTVSLSGNSKFGKNPIVTCSTATTSALGATAITLNLSLGGNGANNAVFSTTSAVSGKQIKSCFVTATAIQVTGAHATVVETITFKYGNLASSTVTKNLITWNSGVSAKAVNKNSVVAKVTAGFNKFTGGATVTAGGIVQALPKAFASASTATIGKIGAMGTYLSSATITFAGAPLAQAKSTAGVYIVSGGKVCSTANRIGSAKGGASTVTFRTVPGNASAGIKGCFAYSGTSAISAGTITATLGGVAKTNFSVPTFTSADVLEITRDGSSVSLVNMPRSTDTDTGFLRVYNNSSIAGAITATIYDQNGTALTSNCSLSSSLASQAALVMSAAQIETACGFTVPTTGRYRLEIAGAIPSMQAQMFARSAGVLTNITSFTGK